MIVTDGTLLKCLSHGPQKILGEEDKNGLFKRYVCLHSTVVGGIGVVGGSGKGCGLTLLPMYEGAMDKAELIRHRDYGG